MPKISIFQFALDVRHFAQFLQQTVILRMSLFECE